MHVEQVLSDVPSEQRCACRQAPKDANDEQKKSALRRFLGL
jgi:hypothetical protein